MSWLAAIGGYALAGAEAIGGAVATGAEAVGASALESPIGKVATTGFEMAAEAFSPTAVGGELGQKSLMSVGEMPTGGVDPGFSVGDMQKDVKATPTKGYEFGKAVGELATSGGGGGKATPLPTGDLSKGMSARATAGPAQSSAGQGKQKMSMSSNTSQAASQPEAFKGFDSYLAEAFGSNTDVISQTMGSNSNG